MLVLSRKKDESLVIGDKIEVTVVDIRGDKIRLGVRAPREVPVHRQEIYDAILRENGNTLGRAPSGIDQWGPPSDVLLVISRKKNECLIIADCIRVVVVEIRGDKVRLGIESPKELCPHRREVWDAIKQMSDAPRLAE